MIGDFEAEPIITFKDKLVHFLKFLDEGEPAVAEVPTGFTDTEGKPITKEIKAVKFNVDDGEGVKTYTPIAKKFINQLEELYPLTNSTLRIELREGRDKTQNTYLVQVIE